MNNYSLEHVHYIKCIKKENSLIIFFRLLFIITLLTIWEVLARFNVINTFMYSSPSKIVTTIYNLFVNGNLLSHIFVTLYEILLSFTISFLFGILIATFFWSNSFIQKVFDPYLTILNSLPKVALGPLIIIWFGAGRNSIIFMSLLISIFITIINVYQGFISTNKNHINMIKSFGANKYHIFKYIVLPENFSNIVSALKVNTSMNLIGVIMGELLVSKKGLGYLIMYGFQIFNIDLVISCVFILGIISYVMYLIINKIK